MWSKKELIDKQARFWVLMAAGSTLQAACDAVGVDRRTGRHWRQATGGRIPRKKPEPSGRYLSLEERLQIADLHLAETGVRADLHQHLRTGRAARRPRRSTTKGPSGKIPDMILISERPADVADRAVPGHWEGDLILGSNCRSAIATLVERQTRFTMLVHLPDGHGAIAVRDGLQATIQTLPEHLRKTLTWDQGTELAQHRQITLATKMAIYFCDPHSPWQRGTNENTNGLLRQYFPKGTDLSIHPPERLLEVATELNARPRKTLGGITPAEALQRLLFEPEPPIVATTA